VINKQCVVLVMMFFLMMGKGHTKYVELWTIKEVFYVKLFGLIFQENVLRTYEGKFNYFQVFIYVKC
jgi:hypothetical protein